MPGVCRLWVKSTRYSGRGARHLGVGKLERRVKLRIRGCHWLVLHFFIGARVLIKGRWCHGRGGGDKGTLLFDRDGGAAGWLKNDEYTRH